MQEAYFSFDNQHETTCYLDLGDRHVLRRSAATETKTKTRL